MDEKTKETEQEKPVETAEETVVENTAAETTEESVSEAVEETEAEAVVESKDEALDEVKPAKQKNKRLINALIRTGAALIAAVLLLFVTKLSVIDIIKGAKETDTAHYETSGSFVKQDIGMMLGNLKDQGLSENYMVAGIVDKLVIVHFTDRYLNSATSVLNDSLKYFDGELTDLDKYVTVEGTVEKQSEELSGDFYKWYAANKDWMVEKHVIAETDDDSTYISDMVINVDTVNSMSETLVWVLSGLAAALVLYMIVELVLMASGFYLREPKNKLAVAEGTTEDTEDEQETADTSDEEEEKDGDACEKCIKDEEKPENNGDSEEASEKKTEEDKE